MNSTDFPTTVSRIEAAGHTARRLAADVLGPPRPDADRRARRLRHARRTVALTATVAVLVQVIVWLMIALLGGGLDVPWWLWTVVPSAIAVAVLTVAERRHRTGTAAV